MKCDISVTTVMSWYQDSPNHFMIAILINAYETTIKMTDGLSMKKILPRKGFDAEISRIRGGKVFLRTISSLWQRSAYQTLYISLRPSWHMFLPPTFISFTHLDRWLCYIQQSNH